MWGRARRESFLRRTNTRITTTHTSDRGGGIYILLNWTSKIHCTHFIHSFLNYSWFQHLNICSVTSQVSLWPHVHSHTVCPSVADGGPRSFLRLLQHLFMVWHIYSQGWFSSSIWRLCRSASRAKREIKTEDEIRERAWHPQKVFLMRL